MRDRSSLNVFFKYDRKVLFMILFILLVSVLTLTVVYASLSTLLQINGHAEVSAASWDIYLDNVQLNSGSTTTAVPIITDSRTATFSTTLSIPGDFYEFSIDVVNNGTIDAMIDSITKTPELTDMQKKYLNYIVEYQNGESIATKQLVSKDSFVRLRVKVEFRKDLTASDLPQTSEKLNLSFKVNYTQADDSGTSVPNNGESILKVVDGDLNTVGSEVAIGDEHFYIMSNTDGKITMLAKHNLFVGGRHDGSIWIPYGNEATGIQDATMLGWVSDEHVRNGTTAFSSTNYWSSTISNYPTYVYDNINTSIYKYVENYKFYLESYDIIIVEARLIKYEELIALGCSSSGGGCKSAPEWVYSSSYWSGTAKSSSAIFGISTNSYFSNGDGAINYYSGVRPVIVVKS